MGKLLLVSVILATVVLPMRAARHPSPAIALRRALVWTGAYFLWYVAAVLYLLPLLG